MPSSSKIDVEQGCCTSRVPTTLPCRGFSATDFSYLEVHRQWNFITISIEFLNLDVYEYQGTSLGRMWLRSRKYIRIKMPWQPHPWRMDFVERYESSTAQ